MKKLLWIVPVMMVFLSCKQSKGQAADQNKFSILIFHDSVIVYNGILDRHTVYKKYLSTEPEKLGEAIDKHRHKYGTQSEIHLKIAFEGEDDFSFHLSDHLQYMKDIALQNSGPDLKLVDVTDVEEKFFKILPFKWSFIDSFNKPKALDLKLPKEDENEIQPSQTPNTVTVILMTEKEWYCYSGTGFTNGKTYSSKDFRILLTQKKKQWGDSLFVIIKPSEQATYKATVDALDEMILNKIERYAMARLTLDEKLFLNTDNQKSDPPEPVSITTPGSVSTSAMPDDNAFLIEIRKDNSVWYQPISPLIKMAPQKVNAPITKNLKKIITDYEKASPDKKKTYLIKGDGNATYPVFEQVINALKENNIYKYTLITSEN